MTLTNGQILLIFSVRKKIMHIQMLKPKGIPRFDEVSDNIRFQDEVVFTALLAYKILSLLTLTVADMFIFLFLYLTCFLDSSIYVVFCLCSVSDLQDCWIGLNRDTTVCTCSQVSDEDCETCRATWSWTDGTEMSWWRWQPREPGTSSCGRLSVTGWAEIACERQYRFICERGMKEIQLL